MLFRSLGELAYCVFAGLADSYAESIKQLESITGTKYNTVNIFGGGCNNDFLSELTAERTKKRVVTGPAESTAIGNLLMQMIGRRRIADIYAARRIVKKSFKITEIGL